MAVGGTSFEGGLGARGRKGSRARSLARAGKGAAARFEALKGAAARFEALNAASGARIEAARGQVVLDLPALGLAPGACREDRATGAQGDKGTAGIGADGTHGAMPKGGSRGARGESASAEPREPRGAAGSGTSMAGAEMTPAERERLTALAVGAKIVRAAAAARILMRRRAAKRTQTGFMHYCWASPDPLQEGRHTREIGAKLDEALARLKQGLSTYLLIDIPFRHGKSDIGTRYFPARVLGEMPDLEIMVASYGHDLAKDFARDTRDILRSETYRALYPEIVVDPSASSVDQIRIKGRRGKLNYLGLTGGLTGKGAHVLLIDDYYKDREQADNKLQREKTWESIENAITRLAPAHIVVILANRWHPDDVHGRIAKKMADDPKFPRFQKLHFPARKARPEELGGGWDYLFPERYGPEWYEMQFSALSDYAANAQLQGEPTARGGNMLKVAGIQFYDEGEAPVGLLWVRFWDLASREKQLSGRDPDYTAGARVAVSLAPTPLGADGRPIKNAPRIWHVWVDDMRWTQSIATNRNALIVDTALGDGPGVWQGTEGVGGYTDTAPLLQQHLAHICQVHDVPVRRDKVTCAQMENIDGAFDRCRVHFRRGWWNEAAIEELGQFPNGTHDDKAEAVIKGALLAIKRYDEAAAFGGALGENGVAA